MLWNSLQNCGQPFFANPQAALLYPPLLVFLVFPIEIGLLVVPALHLAIGGLGAYYLCRELELSRFAAICGAAAFELGGNALVLASWMPIISGAYAWMPVALFLCERILRRASAASVALLAAVLAIQLFAGYPQLSFFTYELIALRVLWAVTVRRASLRAAGLVALGSVAAPLLAAIHLFPATEFAGESVRNVALGPTELNVMSATWEGFRALMGKGQTGPGTTFALASMTLAGAALARRGARAEAAFYIAVTALNLALAFDNPVSALYRSSPIGGIFRGPDRFLWPTGMGFSVVVAFGAQSLAALPSASRAGAAGTVVGLALGAATFLLLTPADPTGVEVFSLACLALALLAYRGPVPLRSLATLAVAAGLFVNLIAVAGTPYLASITGTDALMRKHERAVDHVRERMTLAQRMHQVGSHADYSLMPKTPSVYGVRGISDYEPMTSQRYAEYYVKLVAGAEAHHWMESLNQFYFLRPQFPRNRALLNLSAARFVLVDSERLPTAPLTLDGFEPSSTGQRVHVYENTRALPRAFFVPQIVAYPRPRALLNRLSLDEHDPTLAAFVDAPPADGFTGTPGTFGRAEIVGDRSEELTVDTIASADGFLFVADQYYPGWQATVNGTPAPIMRANYAFRAVRVPSGEARVVFRYEPRSLRIGAAVSAVTALALVAFVLYSPVRRRLAPRLQ